MFALSFAVVAVLLLGPVPALLARARWPLRAPRAAVVLWQSIAAAAVLSAFSVGIAIASRLLMPGPDGRPTATFLDDIDRFGWLLWTLYTASLALTVLVGVRLVAAVLQVMIGTRRRRARHRALVDLVGVAQTDTALGDRTPGLRILAFPQPVAYCLPGVRSRVVLSAGTLERLHSDEVGAVLSHERAHLRVRHDLVLEAFVALHTAFPRFVRSANALGAVRLLVELLADDAAVRTAGPAPLARALVACADVGAPAGALAVSGANTVVRVRRLTRTGNSRRVAAAAYLAAISVLAVPTVALAIPWLTELHRLLAG